MWVFIKPVKRRGWLDALPLQCQKCGKDCRIVHGRQPLDVECGKSSFE